MSGSLPDDVHYLTPGAKLGLQYAMVTKPSTTHVCSNIAITLASFVLVVSYILPAGIYVIIKKKR